eukprot:6186246-Pleurochrysis_carterae.AAC.3
MSSLHTAHSLCTKCVLTGKWAFFAAEFQANNFHVLTACTCQLLLEAGCNKLPQIKKLDSPQSSQRLLHIA